MSDIPKNIQSFNLYCLTLFAQLYEAFPKPVRVEVATLSSHATAPTASYEEAWSSIEMAGNVVSWLKDEGVIRITGTTPVGDFADVVLTLKALTLLGYVPTSLQEAERKEPIIDKIKKALASGAEKAAADGVKSILTELFRMAITVAPAATAAGLVAV